MNLNSREVERQTRRLQRLKAERKKLLQAHYADAITVELLKEEQSRITSEEEAAQRILDACALRFEDIERNLEDALTLVADCQKAYLNAPDEVRRSFNQALFDRIWIGEHGVAGVDLQLPFAHLLAHDLVERLEHEARGLTEPEPIAHRRELPIDPTQRPDGPFSWENENHDLLFVGHGSNVSCLVGPVGLEPTTVGLKVRCSARLSYGPDERVVGAGRRNIGYIGGPSGRSTRASSLNPWRSYSVRFSSVLASR